MQTYPLGYQVPQVVLKDSMHEIIYGLYAQTRHFSYCLSRWISHFGTKSMLAELLLVHFGFILKSQCFGGEGGKINMCTLSHCQKLQGMAW